MKKNLVYAVLVLACFLTGALPGYAQDVNPSLAEAERFFEEAKRSDNPYIAQMARESLSKLQTKEGANKVSVEVPLMTRNNASLAVPTLLNQKVMGTFLVDTGATYTVITPRIAQKLGIEVTPDTPRVSIITANGPIQAPKVVVASITIGGIECRDVEVIIQPLGTDILLAGLLGMNFFKDMELSFKQNKMILTVDQPAGNSINTANAGSP